MQPVTVLTPKRRQAALARLKERPLDEWSALIDRVQRSSFCRGINDHGWVASFWWLISTPDVAAKIEEGMYDDRAGRERAFTEAELRDARRMREVNGGCRHDPRCEDWNACIAAIIRQWRANRGEAA